MRAKTHTYVLLVAIGAVLAAAGIAAIEPRVPIESIKVVALLSGFALAAEGMGFFFSRSVIGSMAFIPYLAAVLISPTWVPVAGAAIVRVLCERRKEPIKVFFNVSQHILTVAVTALFFRAIGGVALESLRSQSLLDISRAIGFQAIFTIVFSLGFSSILVSGVIARSADRLWRVVWRENYLPTIGTDVLAAPVIFMFAWVYVSLGPIAAATIWVPILGLRQVNKANVDLQQTNRELLELMVKSIEARDPYTSGHSRRVHHYSVAIARALGLSEKLIERVGQAALLHDVGKIHEKYAPILRNPNRLSADEWLVMKEHPIDGANLISTVSGLRQLVAPVRGHHENWDGTGYPDGIAGETIPLESRIIMFADTIDAMTSERPYRPSLGADQVRAEIVRARGKQFDPELADRILAANVWSVLFPDKKGARFESGLRLERADRQSTSA